jgi:hypothetical protein
VTASTPAKQDKRLVDVDLEALGQDSVSLFDQDAAVHRRLQMFSE